MFTVGEPLPAPTLAATGKAPRVLTLSRYYPRREELAAGVLDGGAAYELADVGGWLATPDGPAQRRKHVYLIEAGSILNTAGGRTVAGCLVDVRPTYTSQNGRLTIRCTAMDLRSLCLWARRGNGDQTAQIYRLTITTLTPLHIGVGQVLRRDYDYAVHRGATWVIDNAKLADEIYASADGTRGHSLVAGRPAAEVLTPKDFRPDSPLFRYILQDEPQAQSTGAIIQEVTKNPWDQPYIPGSSLKGIPPYRLPGRSFPPAEAAV